jgi:hypothetical protein
VPDSGDGTESPTNGEPGEETSGDQSTVEQTSGEDTGDQSTVGNGSATGEADALGLLAEAEDLFSQADELLRAGDLGGYQQTVDLAKAKIAEAVDALQN